jgi:hypothetical protein
MRGDSVTALAVSDELRTCTAERSAMYLPTTTRQMRMRHSCAARAHGPAQRRRRRVGDVCAW